MTYYEWLLLKRCITSKNGYTIKRHQCGDGGGGGMYNGAGMAGGSVIMKTRNAR